MTDDLIARLETKQPYKSALQIACEDDGIGAQVIVLGQGDYPSMRQLADRATDDMNEAATRIRHQAARIAELEVRLLDVSASLLGALSLLNGGGKKAAWSDRVFEIMLDDYQDSLDRARAALKREG